MSSQKKYTPRGFVTGVTLLYTALTLVLGVQFFVPEKVAVFYKEAMTAATNNYSHLALEGSTSGPGGGANSGGGFGPSGGGYSGAGGNDSPSESAGGPGSGGGSSSSGGGGSHGTGGGSTSGGTNGGREGSTSGPGGGANSGGGFGPGGGTGGGSGSGGGTGSGSGTGGGNLGGNNAGSNSPCGGCDPNTGGEVDADSMGDFTRAVGSFGVGSVASFFGTAYNAAKDLVSKSIGFSFGTLGSVTNVTSNPTTKAPNTAIPSRTEPNPISASELSKVFGTGYLTPTLSKTLSKTQLSQFYSALEETRVNEAVVASLQKELTKNAPASVKAEIAATSPTGFGVGAVPSTGLSKKDKSILGQLYSPTDVSRINAAIDAAIEQSLKSQTAIDAAIPVGQLTPELRAARAVVEQNQQLVESVYKSLPRSFSEAVSIVKDSLVNTINQAINDPVYDSIATLLNSNNFTLIGVKPTDLTLKERQDIALAQQTAGVPVTVVGPYYDDLKSRHVILGVDQAKMKGLPPGSVSYYPTDINTAYNVAFEPRVVDALSKLYNLTRMVPTLTKVGATSITISYDAKTIANFSVNDMKAMQDYMKQAGFTGVTDYTSAVGTFDLKTTPNTDKTAFSITHNTNRALSPGAKSQVRADGTDYSDYVATEDRIGAAKEIDFDTNPRLSTTPSLKDTSVRFAPTMTPDEIQRAAVTRTLQDTAHLVPNPTNVPMTNVYGRINVSSTQIDKTDIARLARGLSDTITSGIPTSRPSGLPDTTGVTPTSRTGLPNTTTATPSSKPTLGTKTKQEVANSISARLADDLTPAKRATISQQIYNGLSVVDLTWDIQTATIPTVTSQQSYIDRVVQQVVNRDEVTAITTPAERQVVATAVRDELKTSLKPAPTVTNTVTAPTIDTDVTVTTATAPTRPNPVTKAVTDVLRSIGVIKDTNTTVPNIKTTELIGNDTTFEGLPTTREGGKGFFCNWFGVGC